MSFIIYGFIFSCGGGSGGGGGGGGGGEILEGKNGQSNEAHR